MKKKCFVLIFVTFFQKKNVKKKVDYFAPIKMENKVNALRKSVDKLSKKQNKSIEEDSKAQEPRIIEVESLKALNKADLEMI